MPFISDTESRAQMQSMTVDDGRVLADWDEVFDASVGNVIDEGLSISRMLNNEIFEQRRDAAKIIFESGEDRSKYTNRRGRLNYDALSAKFPEQIKTDAALAEEKKAILAKRREYFNDVMSRSDSTSAELLGSMNAFMLDPLNVATMGIGTPFAVAKGVGVLDKTIRSALGAGAINVGTEALIQPMVLDYKLDIDSPYGAEDAIANIAMAAGGGLILGGTVGGISGWLSRIRGEADTVRGKLPEDIDPVEVDIAVRQVDDAIDILARNPNKIEVPDIAVIAKSFDTVDYFDVRLKRDYFRAEAKDIVENDFVEGGGISIVDDPTFVRGESDIPGSVPQARSSSVHPQWIQDVLSESGLPVKKVRAALEKSLAGEKLGKRQTKAVELILDHIEAERTLPERVEFAREQREAGRQIRRETLGKPQKLTKAEILKEQEGAPEHFYIDRETGDKVTISKETLDEYNRLNQQAIDSDAAWLSAIEEERARINRTPDTKPEITAKEINDAELEAVVNAMDKPMVSIDGELVDAGKLIKQFDDDIDALESMKVCMLG